MYKFNYPILKKARKTLRFNAGEVAHSIGINKSTLYRYENKESYINVYTLELLMMIYHLTPEDIFVKEDDV